MRSRRTPTRTRPQQPGLTGPLDLLQQLGDGFIMGSLDTLEWAVEETAEQTGYLARRAGQKALRGIGRAIRRSRHGD